MSADPPQVVLAPDKFKGSATAAAVADSLALGIADRAPDVTTIRCPIADGGDGTVAALLAAGYSALTVAAADALRRPRPAVVAVQGDRAVVELAAVCGLADLGSARDPLRASSFGLGLALAELIERGYREITLALGGSASTDGGLGMLHALGALARDADGADVAPDGSGLLAVADLDLSEVRLPAGLQVTVASDVDNPLHGPDGAALAFGGQKGLTPSLLPQFDNALERWGLLLEARTGRSVANTPGAGAAGGVGAAAVAVLGAEVVSGADLVLDAVGFDEHLEGAALVVTGEGCWDAGTLRGKGPGQVLRRSRARGVPVTVVAGQVLAPPAEDGVSAWFSLAELAGSVSAAKKRTTPLLRQIGATIGSGLTPGP